MKYIIILLINITVYGNDLLQITPNDNYKKMISYNTIYLKSLGLSNENNMYFLFKVKSHTNIIYGFRYRDNMDAPLPYTFIAYNMNTKQKIIDETNSYSGLPWNNKSKNYTNLTRFAVVDIDNDNISELIIPYILGASSYSLNVYKYINYTTKIIFSEGEKITYIHKTNNIYEIIVSGFPQINGNKRVSILKHYIYNKKSQKYEMNYKNEYIYE